MQRITDTIEKVQKEVDCATIDLKSLEILMSNAYKTATEKAIHLSDERLLALGVHFFAVLKRVAQSEKLPAVDADVLSEIDEDLRNASGKIMELCDLTNHLANDETEKLLVAVHLATAKYG